MAEVKTNLRSVPRDIPPMKEPHNHCRGPLCGPERTCGHWAAYHSAFYNDMMGPPPLVWGGNSGSIIPLSAVRAKPGWLFFANPVCLLTFYPHRIQREDIRTYLEMLSRLCNTVVLEKTWRCSSQAQFTWLLWLRNPQAEPLVLTIEIVLWCQVWQAQILVPPRHGGRQ